MSFIIDLKAREILDSRGNPTIEVDVLLDSGVLGRAAVPSGASTGEHEAIELRDKDKSRYMGKGVTKAVNNVNTTIAEAIVGKESFYKTIDKICIDLDGTNNKGKLGANAILGVSLACARLGAKINRQPLYKYIRQLSQIPASKFQIPIPLFNIFNGGKHADTNLDFQEFMVIPIMNVTFKERLRVGAEIFHSLGKVLQAEGLDIDLGNEGGYAPHVDSAIKVLDYILEGIRKANYQPAKQIVLGLDAGATTFYLAKEKLYNFSMDESFLDPDQLVYLYQEWFAKYPFRL